ncbi:MAG TPA: hypothetical protein VFO46_13560 [Candidatus Sulfotelmatobacter sp.]|nr:hypothetical protein [Candidatus Sulfotelmatobacter sp.]
MNPPICPVCQGTGMKLWSRHEVCPNCEGLGKMPIQYVCDGAQDDRPNKGEEEE